MRKQRPENRHLWILRKRLIDTTMDIIAAEWRSGAYGDIGIVAYKTADHNPSLGQWCAAMGVARNDNLPLDEQEVAGYGCKLSWQEAQAFFPQLDITKYKYYTEGRQT